MQLNLFQKNIVLIGVFDVNQFDKYFFIKNQIVKEEEILVGSMFDVMGVKQLITEEFTLLISQAQIIISDIKLTNSNKISEVVLIILSIAPLWELNAMGFNFHLNSKCEDIENETKRLFYNENDKLISRFFNSQDAMFGTYASADFIKSRMKLEIKPVVLTSVVNNVNVDSSDNINFAFNFHFELFLKGLNIIEILEDYSTYSNKYKEMISVY